MHFHLFLSFVSSWQIPCSHLAAPNTDHVCHTGWHTVPAVQHNQVTHLCVARHVLRALLNDLTEYVRATRKCISAARVERPWDSDLGILKQILEFSASFSFQTCATLLPFYNSVVDADPNAAEICSNCVKRSASACPLLLKEVQGCSVANVRFEP